MPQLRFVNGGGTGSIAQTVAEPVVSEVTAGSGFYAPMLFQYYRGFALAPGGRVRAQSLNRRPGPGVITALGGGYVASGARPARTANPSPAWPLGLKLDPLEGAGEAQTPLARRRRRWHCQRRWPGLSAPRQGGGSCVSASTHCYVIEDGRLAGELATYRGEGQAFL